MAKYRIYASCQINYYVDVEAESKEEAREMYDDIDGGEFTECGSCWDFEYIEELKEETTA